MSSWMLAFRATEEAFKQLDGPVASYLDHWFSLLEGEVPGDVVADIADTDLAVRDARNRGLLFNPDVDKVWAQISRLLTEPVAEQIRLLAGRQRACPHERDERGRRRGRDQRVAEAHRGGVARHPRPLRRPGQPRRLRVDRPRQRGDRRGRPLLDGLQLSGAGPLRNRFELGAQFDFGVVDSDENRVYTGPTSTAPASPTGCSSTPTTTPRAGRPTCAPGTRCSPTARPRSTPRCCTTAGRSARCSTASTSARRTARPTPRRSSTSTSGARSRSSAARSRRCSPTKEAGAWTGTLFLNGADQSTEGEVRVRIEHEPTSLRSARQTVTWEGGLERRYTFDRYRDGARTMYEGPEVFGNATSYGRALFTSQHLVGADHTGVEKIRGREFLIDPTTRELAVVWQPVHRRHHHALRTRLAGVGAAMTGALLGSRRRRHRRHPRGSASASRGSSWPVVRAS